MLRHKLVSNRSKMKQQLKSIIRNKAMIHHKKIPTFGTNSGSGAMREKTTRPSFWTKMKSSRKSKLPLRIALATGETIWRLPFLIEGTITRPWGTSKMSCRTSWMKKIKSNSAVGTTSSIYLAEAVKRCRKRLLGTLSRNSWRSLLIIVMSLINSTKSSSIQLTTNK